MSKLKELCKNVIKQLYTYVPLPSKVSSVTRFLDIGEKLHHQSEHSHLNHQMTSRMQNPSFRQLGNPWCRLNLERSQP